MAIILLINLEQQKVFFEIALKIPLCTASVIKTVKKKITLDVIRNGAMSLSFLKE